MKQEDKELLLKDLCARLPYNVKVGRQNCFNPNKVEVENISEIISHCSYEDLVGLIDNLHLKPYLRPMSSMTEEEKEEYSKLCFEISYNAETEKWGTILFDWLNANHFDYRHFIEKGLAIESPVGMYK